MLVLLFAMHRDYRPLTYAPSLFLELLRFIFWRENTELDAQRLYQPSRPFKRQLFFALAETVEARNGHARFVRPLRERPAFSLGQFFHGRESLL